MPKLAIPTALLQHSLIRLTYSKPHSIFLNFKRQHNQTKADKRPELGPETALAHNITNYRRCRRIDGRAPIKMTNQK